MADDPLAAIAHDLYGLDPGEFTASRNEAAKQAKADGAADLAAALKALPKPSTAAWLVNQLTRHRGVELEELLAVGDALRAATEAADAAQLKDLNAKRRAVLAAMARQAQGLGRELGHPVSDAVAREVEETLHAGLVDVDAAHALRSGRLVAALSPAGFGSVDLTGAVAAPELLGGGSPASARKPARAGKKDAEAERARAAELERARVSADEANTALEQATADADAAEEAAADAHRRSEHAESLVEERTEALRQARTDLEEADRSEREARAALRASAQALTDAQRAADRAAAAVRDLEQ